MRVFEIMTEGVQTVPPTMPAADAWELMRRKRIHHLVVTRNSDVVGLLSDRDTGSGVGADVRAGHTVEDLMTSQVVTVRANDTIRALTNVMRGRTIGCAPVVEGKRLVGIMTVSDLLRLLGRGIDRPVKPSRRTATHRVPHRKGHRSGGSDRVARGREIVGYGLTREAALRYRSAFGAQDPVNRRTRVTLNSRGATLPVPGGLAP